MYSGLLKISEGQKIKQYIWEDEGSEKVLVFRNAEVSLYDDETLGISLFKNIHKVMGLIKENNIKIRRGNDDEGFILIYIDTKDFKKMMPFLGERTCKMRKNGRDLKEAEKCLAHRLIHTSSLRDNKAFLS